MKDCCFLIDLSPCKIDGTRKVRYKHIDRASTRDLFRGAERTTPLDPLVVLALPLRHPRRTLHCPHLRTRASGTSWPYHGSSPPVVYAASNGHQERLDFGFALRLAQRDRHVKHTFEQQSSWLYSESEVSTSPPALRIEKKKSFSDSETDSANDSESLSSRPASAWLKPQWIISAHVSGGTNHRGIQAQEGAQNFTFQVKPEGHRSQHHDLASDRQCGATAMNTRAVGKLLLGAQPAWPSLAYSVQKRI